MAALALLMPALVATEFKPWIFFDPDGAVAYLRSKSGQRGKTGVSRRATAWITETAVRWKS